MNHHPSMTVHYQSCVLHYNTHDVAGLSALDFAAAQRVDAWLSGTQ
jgi:4a-hydroxytetrahydrobiopterin dehydratase